MPLIRTIAIFLLLLSPAAAAQETVESVPDPAALAFRVGAGDHLRIDFYVQPELSRIYPVRPDGEISVHLLGTLDVAGLTLTEVETLIRRRAQEIFQSTSASVIVEMARFRDFYVQGAVSDPGAFPYRPGLTAQQAIALAGGTGSIIRAESAADLDRILDRQRDLAMARGRILQLERRAGRLDAQLAGPDADDPLAALSGRIVETEVRAHELRQALAQSETDIHRRNTEVLETRLSRAVSEVERMNDLDARGLIRADRMNEVEERADRFRSDLLEVAAESARAARIGSDAENDAVLARLDYRAALLEERANFADDLEVARTNLRAATDALRRLGGFATLDPADGMREVWTISRQDEDGLATLKATARTRLLPGDVLTVLIATTGD